MSKIDCYECAKCKAKSFDFMGDGWISIKGEFHKYDGRVPECKNGKNNKLGIAFGTAISKIYITTNGTEEHFCSWECLKNIAASKKTS